MNIHAFLALVRKDLRLYFSNRRALVMGIVAPIAIAAFVGYLFAPRQQPSHIPVAVTDLDRSALSAQVVAALKSDPTFELRELSEAQAERGVTQGELRAAIVLPAGFGKAAPGALFGAADKPVVSVRHDPSQPMVLAVVHGLLVQHVMQAVGQTLLSGQGLDGRLGEARERVQHDRAMPDDTRRALLAMVDSIGRVQQRLGEDAGTAAASGAASAASAVPARAGGLRLSPPFETRDIAATARQGRPYNSFAHAFAGMGVQFILFGGIELGVGLLLSRRLGLWKRLRAAPVSRSLLLGSRVASGAAIALVLLAAIYAAAIAFFGVRIDGSVLGFVGIAVAFSLLTASFGLLIAALGKTPEATRALAIFVTLIMVMLGGAWVPSFLFPDWLQSVSLAVPTRWAVDGLDAMTWRGMGLDAAWRPIAAMLAFTVLFTVVAVWRFDWEEAAT